MPSRPTNFFGPTKSIRERLSKNFADERRKTNPPSPTYGVASIGKIDNPGSTDPNHGLIAPLLFRSACGTELDRPRI